jgi:pimeloyl-ACP methyl ester carboxylesterase
MNWFILRGLVREQRHWGKFQSVFQSKLIKEHPDGKVFCLDAPGFGTELNRDSPLTIKGIVHDLRERWLVEKNKDPNSNWGILAVSLGGMISMQWTHDYPDDFKRLVVVNSSVSGLSPIHKRFKPKNIPRLIQLMISRDLNHREKNILQMTTNLTGDELAKKIKSNVEIAITSNPARLNAVRQLIAATRFKAVKKIKVPMLVISGLGDQLVHPDCSEQIANHFRAKLVQHETANHDLPTDEPDWVADQVLASKNWQR